MLNNNNDDDHDNDDNNDKIDVNIHVVHAKQKNFFRVLRPSSGSISEVVYIVFKTKLVFIINTNSQFLMCPTLNARLIFNFVTNVT